MARLTLGVPGLLRECIGGAGPRVQIEGSTPSQAIENMIARYPRLKVHVFNEDGVVREHVFLALNGRKLQPEDLSRPLLDGDKLDVVQAVSGG